jgi:hypothetical protein
MVKWGMRITPMVLFAKEQSYRRWKPEYFCEDKAMIWGLFEFYHNFWGSKPFSYTFAMCATASQALAKSEAEGSRVTWYWLQ